jgi:hypothetical protein
MLNFETTISVEEGMKRVIAWREELKHQKSPPAEA